MLSAGTLTPLALLFAGAGVGLGYFSGVLGEKFLFEKNWNQLQDVTNNYRKN